MLIAPQHGFVFLALHKTGTTAIERAFESYAEVKLDLTPALKHTTYSEFQRFLEPWLAAKGFPRDSYEVVCTVREPIQWLASWWRYRSRKALANPSHPRHANFAGHLTFEEFAYAYMRGESISDRIVAPSKFIQPASGIGGNETRPIDRLFRYERLDLLADLLRKKVSEAVEIHVRNISPGRTPSLSGECERELRRFLMPDLRVYARATG